MQTVSSRLVGSGPETLQVRLVRAEIGNSGLKSAHTDRHPTTSSKTQGRERLETLAHERAIVESRLSAEALQQPLCLGIQACVDLLLLQVSLRIQTVTGSQSTDFRNVNVGSR